MRHQVDKSRAILEYSAKPTNAQAVFFLKLKQTARHAIADSVDPFIYQEFQNCIQRRGNITKRVKDAMADPLRAEILRQLVDEDINYGLTIIALNGGERSRVVYGSEIKLQHELPLSRALRDCFTEFNDQHGHSNVGGQVTRAIEWLSACARFVPEKLSYASR